MTTNDNGPTEHVEGQQPLPETPTETAPLADAPADSSPEGAASVTPPASDPPDDGTPEPAPVTDVPYAPEYVVPDPATQAQLDAQVPDDPTPLPADGEDEGDDSTTPAATP